MRSQGSTLFGIIPTYLCSNVLNPETDSNCCSGILVQCQHTAVCVAFNLLKLTVTSYQYLEMSHKSKCVVTYQTKVI